LDCDSNRAYTPHVPKVGGGGCRDRYETKTIGVAKKGFPVWEKTTMIGPNGMQSFSTTNEESSFHKRHSTRVCSMCLMVIAKCRTSRVLSLPRMAQLELPTPRRHHQPFRAHSARRQLRTR